MRANRSPETLNTRSLRVSDREGKPENRKIATVLKAFRALKGSGCRAAPSVMKARQLDYTKLRHAAALALVGWYLMIPPLPTTSGWFSNNSGPAPISQWKLWASFDSAMLCEAYRGADDSTWLDRVRRLAAEELADEAEERRNPSKFKASKVANEEFDKFKDSMDRARCIETDDPRLKGN
jgi:hypothetical protein